MREQVPARKLKAGDRIRRGVSTYTVMSGVTEGGSTRLHLQNDERASRVATSADAIFIRVERAEDTDGRTK